MPADQSLSVVVPLIYLIVLKIADVSREINLRAIQGNDGWMIFSPVSGFTSVAKLGRFTYLHALNHTILLGTLATIAYILEGSALDVLFHRNGPVLTGLLGAFTFIVWLCLPLFEVDEYGEIITDGIPISMNKHIMSVIETSGYLLAAVHLYNHLTPDYTLTIIVMGVGAIGYSVVYFSLHTPHLLFLWVPALMGMLGVRLFQSKSLPEFLVGLGALTMGVLVFVNTFRGIEIFLSVLDKEIIDTN